VRWACRPGVCHTCETGLIIGAVGYQLEPVELPAVSAARAAILKVAREFGTGSSVVQRIKAEVTSVPG
jgi:hypothetical protein